MITKDDLVMTIAIDDLTIKPLSANDYEALFDFEQRNWDYFKQAVGARPDTYRKYDSFCDVQSEIMQKQADGTIAFYLIYQEDKVVGRINLRDIQKGCANLGYRICESVIRQGIASFAVKQILQIAKQRGVTRLNAQVADTNLASEKVLHKNGFKYSHTEVEAVSLNDTMINLKHFYKMITYP